MVFNIPGIMEEDLIEKMLNIIQTCHKNRKTEWVNVFFFFHVLSIILSDTFSGCKLTVTNCPERLYSWENGSIVIAAFTTRLHFKSIFNSILAVG